MFPFHIQIYIFNLAHEWIALVYHGCEVSNFQKFKNKQSENMGLFQKSRGKVRINVVSGMQEMNKIFN